ncbi:MAG: hypothetical protein J6X18_00645 [Bacteroidales bacterium]|nr:hypothetical protein [Bacteroidales bacterium]
MIIIIGKKDRDLMRDAQAYVHQCGLNFFHDGVTKYENAKVLNKDCQSIANRILKALGDKYRHYWN